LNTAGKMSIYAQGKKLGARAAALLTPAWADSDFVALTAACALSKMDPLDLMVVMTNEANLEPSARNPRSKDRWPIAVGLNQINQIAATAMGLITKGDDAGWQKLADAIVAMRPSDQIPIVLTYFNTTARGKAGLSWPSATQIYLANAGGGLSMIPVQDSTVIYRAGTAEYEGNTGLDLDGKGTITGKDLRIVCDRMTTTAVYQAAAFRWALPSLRQGYRYGWAAGTSRQPAAAASSIPAGLDADFYAAAYLEAYEAGFHAPVGSTTTFPTYLT